MYWLSNSLSQLGQFEEALALSKERLEVIQLKGSSVSFYDPPSPIAWECHALGELGKCYTDLLRYAEATAVHKQQLETAKKIDSLEQEADALSPSRRRSEGRLLQLLRDHQTSDQAN